jgi:hypothetical protein
MKRLWLIGALAGLMGCTSVFDEVSGSVDCVSTDDCAPGDVCFFGRCGSPGLNLSEVYVDFFPPNNSPLLPQRDPGSPRKLEEEGLKHDFILRASVRWEGHVRTPAGEERTGVLSAKPRLAPDAVPLPSTRAGVEALVGEGGFKLRVVPGQYDLVLEPDPELKERPSFRWPAQALSAGTETDPLLLEYPEDNELVTIAGRLLWTDAPAAPMPGVRVRGLVSDAGNRSLVASTGATTREDGAFTLTFPPGIEFYSLRVTPDEDVSIPSVTVDNLLAVAGSVAEVPLGFSSEKISVAVAVLQPSGVPEPDANVVFTGTVGDEVLTGTYTLQARTGTSGVVLVELFPGLYTVTAVPLKSSFHGTRSLVLCAAAPDAPESLCGDASHDFMNAVPLPIPRKQSVRGKVFSHKGAPVPGARVVFSRQEAGLSREFATSTDASGEYRVQLDVPDPNPLSYEVVVEPPKSAGFPRFRQILSVEQSGGFIHDVTLYAPSFVYGRVLGPARQALEGVVISVYSTQLGTTEDPLLVGLGRSTEQGQFVIALPILE